MRRTFDIICTEHGRHHRHTERTCALHLFDTRRSHTADSDDRHADTSTSFLERAHSERGTVDHLGGRLINGTEDNVISSFGFGTCHFFDRMRGDPDQALPS